MNTHDFLKDLAERLAHPSGFAHSDPYAAARALRAIAGCFDADDSYIDFKVRAALRTPAEACVHAAAAKGFTMAVMYEDQCDYIGRDPEAAWAAVTACTEPMVVSLAPSPKADAVDWIYVIWQNGDDDLVDMKYKGWAYHWWEVEGREVYDAF